MSDLFMKLPEGFRERFMQQVVSLTSPEDAMRLPFVSKMFRSVADSDVVWDSFILPDHLPALRGLEMDSAKSLFIVLTETPISFNQVSYFLDRWSGKRRLQISSDKLLVTFLDTDYWISNIPNRWLRLGHVAWLEIKGKVSTSKLSANTTYTAYLRFTFLREFYYGFHVPVETSVGITGEENINKFVYLDPRIAKSECQYLKRREDTLFEVELGDYFHNDGETRDLEMTVREVKSGKPKCGIEIYFMELRPKRESINLYCKSSHKAHSYSERNTERREGEMSKEGEEGWEDTNLFNKLPEGFGQAFMEEVVSRTSPVDACQLSVVAKNFRSAAESDAVWERLLPNDYQQFLCQGDFFPDISFASKKDLFLFLTGNPLPIDANTKIIFWLDKWSGKKCFLMPISTKLYPEGDWNPFCESRHSFVELLLGDYYEEWFGIHGKMSTSKLSPDTTYTAYLVHKWDCGFGYNFSAEKRAPFEASVGSSEDESVNRVVYLHRKIGETGSQYVVERKDSWLEVELGEYFNRGGENKDLEISVVDVISGRSKTGLKIQGIEIRPKHG
ncbi:hypothetical protein POM88_049319 [Heracleum sosnowskyi]|uniref:F-box domain-containing protein n=1 Tax=Heracleum sosnowskyi TaxID=360622 RepID=A0AAD8GWV5_9APIA|nr:hypothetical protein POM88_049319 [Heracleum sosnowskyi]